MRATDRRPDKGRFLAQVAGLRELARYVIVSCFFTPKSKSDFNAAKVVEVEIPTPPGA